MVKVKGILKDKYTFENSARGHKWLVDEPLEIGGLDLAAKPSEMLLSALVSCKIITVKMYASRKGWDIKNISIELKMGEKVGDKTEIIKSVKIEGDLDLDQINRLIEISGRCPVARLVANSFEFKMLG
ncbi:MAG: OsmC family protein [Crocinitomicaceae bacterium]|jgi:putative redox protein|nr:OsmC family protein [Crocinitomicaceae bacterium]